MMRHLAVLAILAAAAVPAHAQEAHAPQSTADGLGLALSTDIPHRYVSPRGVGFAPENVPASALSPIPPNVEQVKHAYGLGEAYLPDRVRAVPRHHRVAVRYVTRVRPAPVEDAKGRATHDHHRTAEARRHAYD